MSHKNKMLHSHNGNVGTNVWLTPPEIIKSLGEFDLDPSSPINRPWDTAKKHLTVVDDGLKYNWGSYRVWLNPPYDRATIEKWMRKMADHNNGIALLFARTGTDVFHNYIFPFADSLLFIKHYLHFYDVNGIKAKANAGAPSVLIGYGEMNSDALAASGIDGKHILLGRVNVFVVGIDKSWKMIIKSALVNLNSKASVGQIYKMVEDIASEKIRANRHYKEKIRQVLQRHFKRVEKGIYEVD